MLPTPRRLSGSAVTVASAASISTRTGSAAQSLLVLSPYVFGPGFEVYEPPDEDRRVVVLWLVPITSAEARFVRLQGAQAFEQLMQRTEVNVVDPRRASIV